jgi:hypothetical protein
MRKDHQVLSVVTLLLLSSTHVAMSQQTAVVSDTRDGVSHTQPLMLRHDQKRYIRSFRALQGADTDDNDNEDEGDIILGGKGRDNGGSGGSNPAPAPAPSPSPPTSGGGSDGSSTSTEDDSNVWLWFLIFLGLPLGVFLCCRYKDRYGTTLKVLPTEAITEGVRNIRVRHKMPSSSIRTVRSKKRRSQRDLENPSSSPDVRAKAPTPRASIVYDNLTPSTPGTISFSPDVHYVDTVVFVPQAIREEPERQ